MATGTLTQHNKPKHMGKVELFKEKKKGYNLIYTSKIFMVMKFLIFFIKTSLFLG
jgi:hypothetical protein